MIDDKDVPPSDPLWAMNDLICNSFDIVDGTHNGRYIENLNLRTAARCQWLCVHLERVLVDPKYMPHITLIEAQRELEQRRSLIQEYITYYVLGD